MSREILAAALMLLLLTASGLNILSADKLRSDMELHLSQAEEAVLANRPELAAEAIDKALYRWEEAQGYTHIFIRHPEIDSCTDILYDLKEAVLSDANPEATAIFSKLRYHISSIADMEKLRIGNIF